MKIVASIEARMGSTRYPNKMVELIDGKSTLIRVINNIKKVKYINKIILATTKNKQDDILCEIAENEKIFFHRGSEENVYKRVAEAHKKMESDVLVTVCGDCPLIDIGLLEKNIYFFLEKKLDVLGFENKHNYPQGIEFFIFSSKVFYDPLKKIKDKAHKEHVGLFFLENKKKFKIYKVKGNELNTSYNEIRLQFDYKQDLDLLNNIFVHFREKNITHFGLRDIINYLNLNPEIKKINSSCKEKSVR